MSPSEAPPYFLCVENLLLGWACAHTRRGGRPEEALSQQRTRTAQLLIREMRGRPPRTDQSTDRLGRFLALVLRHKPESVGITLDPAGFVEVEVLAQAIAAQPA